MAMPQATRLPCRNVTVVIASTALAVDEARELGVVAVGDPLAVGARLSRGPASRTNSSPFLGSGSAWQRLVYRGAMPNIGLTEIVFFVLIGAVIAAIINVTLRALGIRR
jgi:hypothetical protein